MKFVYPDIDCVFDTEIEKINTIVIENPDLLCSLITDIQNQLSGIDGKAVLSTEEKILPFGKNLELLDRFIPFDLNNKALITGITADLEKKAISDERYSQSNTLLGEIDRFLTEIAFDCPCDIEFTKINVGSIIKAAGVSVCDDYDNLGEKIIDYFELVNEFIGRKTFITVNLRSYLNDKDARLFMSTVTSHGFDVIMIESFEHTKLDEEKRLIIDADLCLIG